MTNDKFKPNAPKTYEQFVLDNQLEQNQAVVNIYAAELGAYGGLEEVQKGYGPCAVCSKTTTTVELKVACPAKNCSNRKETYWVHNKSDCIKNKNRMLISNKGWLNCGGCGTGYNMANWRFACSDHEGDYIEMSQDSWEMSMSIALATGKSTQTTKDLNVYVTNHPKEFGFKDNE